MFFTVFRNNLRNKSYVVKNFMWNLLRVPRTYTVYSNGVLLPYIHITLIKHLNIPWWMHERKRAVCVPVCMSLFVEVFWKSINFTFWKKYVISLHKILSEDSSHLGYELCTNPHDVISQNCGVRTWDSEVFFFVVKGSVADATDAPQSWGFCASLWCKWLVSSFFL
jgi:hypothetical protein